jgi:hypothetical protein
MVPPSFAALPDYKRFGQENHPILAVFSPTLHAIFARLTRKNAWGMCLSSALQITSSLTSSFEVWFNAPGKVRIPRERDS